MAQPSARGSRARGLRRARSAGLAGTRPPLPAERGERAPPPGPDAPFRSRDVVELAGISRRQLQYWIETGLLRPAARTPGGHHRFSFRDLVSLRAARRLLDAGVSLQRLRHSIRALRRALPAVERPLSELVLVATGDVVLVLHRGAAFEAVTGQEWVFEVARFAREVEAWRRETRAGPPGARHAPPRA